MCSGPTRRKARAPTAATRSSTASGRSTEARAAPALRPGSPISPRPGGSRSATSFVHESYIGSRFTGRIEAATKIGDIPAIIPSIQGSAVATGFNTIWIDSDDPFHAGFTVT